MSVINAIIFIEMQLSISIIFTSCLCLCVCFRQWWSGYQYHRDGRRSWYGSGETGNLRQDGDRGWSCAERRQVTRPPVLSSFNPVVTDRPDTFSTPCCLQLLRQQTWGGKKRESKSHEPLLHDSNFKFPKSPCVLDPHISFCIMSAALQRKDQQRQGITESDEVNHKLASKQVIPARFNCCSWQKRCVIVRFLSKSLSHDQCQIGVWTLSSPSISAFTVTVMCA